MEGGQNVCLPVVFRFVEGLLASVIVPEHRHHATDLVSEYSQSTSIVLPEHVGRGESTPIAEGFPYGHKNFLASILTRSRWHGQAKACIAFLKQEICSTANRAPAPPGLTHLLKH